jgi:sugar/nucleoside kinase (ribokinase family)
VSGERDGGGATRVRLKLADLASPPSAAELEAITMAVRQALRAVAPPPMDLGPEQMAWRLGGRWWAQAPGALGRYRRQ